MEMLVYISNLWKYNEGELTGEWFSPPINMEEVKEKIVLNGEYEEYVIHDCELPFSIDEYTPIHEIIGYVRWSKNSKEHPSMTN